MNMQKDLDALYAGLHGYIDLSRDEEAQMRKMSSSSTYGEITTGAAQKLIDYMGLGPKDIFYDLGSGIGKLVVHAAMSSPAKKIVGIELSRGRSNIAQSALKAASRKKLLWSKNAEFWCADLLRRKIDDATVIYSCSTAFPDRFFKKVVKKLEAMSPGFVFISLTEVENSQYLDHIDTLRLNMSWKRNTPVYVYERVDPWFY